MNTRRFLLIVAAFIFFGTMPVSGEESATGIIHPPFPSPKNAKVSVQVLSTGNALEITFTMDGALHVYEDTIAISLRAPKEIKLASPQFPVGKKKTDALTGQERTLFSSGAKVVVPFHSTITKTVVRDFSVDVSWQACSDTLCLMPETKNVTFRGKITPPPTRKQVSERKPPENNRPENKEKSQAEGLIDSWGIIGYYLAGVLLSFTPCIFPMIPVTMSIIGSKEGTPIQGFFRSLVYVFGLALTYAILGLIAAVSGGVIGGAMQTPAVVIFVSALFFIMGLSMMDIVHFQIPSFLQPSGTAKKGSGYLSIFLTGLAAGLVASPCVAPVIVTLLLQISQEGHLLMGFLKLFALGWGLGTILIIVGTFSSALTALPKAGNWMNEVKKALGLMLMLAAFYYLKGVVPKEYFTVLLGIFCIVAGVVSGATDSLPVETPLYPRLVKAMGMVFLIGGIYLFGGQILISGFVHPPLELPSATLLSEAKDKETQWQKGTLEKIAQATAAKKPVVLDFGAKWCGACMELEELTFPLPEVKKALKPFVSLKIDMTKPGAVENEIKEKYGVVGFPTIIFINSKGEVIEKLTKIGFVDGPGFIELLQQVD